MPLLLLLVAASFAAWIMYSRLMRLQEELQRQKQLAFLGEVARGLAHEIRNPLNTIQINLELIEESLEAGPAPDPEKLRRRLGRIHSENHRLTEIINNFMRFSRPPKLKLERVEMVDFLSHTVNFLRPELNLLDILIVEDYPEDPVPVWIDKDQFTQSLLNLITNAKQAMTSARKQLTVSLAVVRDQVRIGIADTGPGVPPEVQAKLFQPYVSTKERGMGIGLAITGRIIDSHQGRVELAETSERGSEFVIWLPREQK